MNIGSIRNCALILLVAASCTQASKPVLVSKVPDQVSRFADGAIDTPARVPVKDTTALTGTPLADSIVAFAKTLIGTPYKFGCTAPETGFDCSGFITYVFNHFNIRVPRSAVDFTNEGITVPLDKARPADLILFTGTNSRVRTVGHIGIVVTNDAGQLTFIQSTSGREYAVVITPLEDYYMTRFVKVIRILK